MPEENYGRNDKVIEPPKATVNNPFGSAANASSPAPTTNNQFGSASNASAPAPTTNNPFGSATTASTPTVAADNSQSATLPLAPWHRPTAPQTPSAIPAQAQPVASPQPAQIQTPVTPAPVAPQQPVASPAPVAPQQPFAGPTPAVPQQPVAPMAPQQPVVGDPNYNPYSQYNPNSVNVAAQSADVADMVGPRGVGGWLAFFMVVFFLSAIANALSLISYISISQMAGGFSTLLIRTMLPILIMNGILAVINLVTGITIAMSKRLGKIMAMIAMVGLVVASIVMAVVSRGEFVSSYSFFGSDSAIQVNAVGSVVISAIECGLVIYYFKVSKRVKATLVK